MVEYGRMVRNAFGAEPGSPEPDRELLERILAEKRITPEQSKECIQLLLDRRASGSTCLLVEVLQEKGYLGTAAPPKEWEERIGRYWVRREIARGGMGVVLEAEDPELKRTVALKVLREEREDQVRRLLREAQIAGGLKHPSIIAVHEVGTAKGERGRDLHYIAMDYVPGPTLADRIKERETPEPELLKILEEVARAVGYAHERGVVHRDVKPSNVLVDGTGRAILTDFGLARLETGTSRLTMSEELIGTPAYMAPEQARGRTKEIDERTDIYALGAMMYEILTGRLPFEKKTSQELLAQIVTEEPKPPSAVKPGIARDLETICLKAMEKEKHRRYAHATELAEDIARHRRAEPIRARPISAWGRWVRRARRNPVLALAGAAICVVLFGSIASWIATRRGATRETARIRATQERREAALKKLAIYQVQIGEVTKYRRRTARNTLAEARERLAPVLAGLAAFIDGWPNEPQGYYLRAKAKMALDDDAGAAEDLKVAVAKSPDFRPGWTLLWLLHERAEQLVMPLSTGATKQELEIRAERSLEMSRRGWIKGREQEEAERWGLAFTEDDHVMDLILQDYQYWHVHDLDCVSDHSREKAILQQGVDKYLSAECAMRLSLTCLDRSEQMTWIDKAISLEPGYPHAYFIRAHRHSARREWDKYLADAKMATELKPTVGEYWMMLGSARSMLGDTAGAREAYTKAVNLMRNPALAHHLRGLLSLGQRHFEDAIEDFRCTIALDSRFADAWCDLGGAFHSAKKAAEALQAYGRALELNPKHARAHLFRGDLLIQLGEYARGADDFLRATQLDPMSAEAFCGLGVAHLLMKKPDDALRAFESAIAIREVYPLAWCGVGDARAAKKEWKSAVSAYERALEQVGAEWDQRPKVEQALRRARERGDER